MAEQVTEIRVKLAGHKSILDACDQDLFRFKREREALEDEKLDVIASLKLEQQKSRQYQQRARKDDFLQRGRSAYCCA